MTWQSHFKAYILRKSQFKKIHAPHLYTAALFTTANTWKQPKGPSTEEWIKMWYIHIYWNITKP